MLMQNCISPNYEQHLYCLIFFFNKVESDGRKYHYNRGYNQESLHHIIQSKSSDVEE